MWFIPVIKLLIRVERDETHNYILATKGLPYSKSELIGMDQLKSMFDEYYIYIITYMKEISYDFCEGCKISKKSGYCDSIQHTNPKCAIDKFVDSSVDKSVDKLINSLKSLKFIYSVRKERDLIYMIPDAIKFEILKDPPKTLLSPKVTLYVDPNENSFILFTDILASILSQMHTNTYCDMFRVYDNMYIAHISYECGWIEFYNSSPDFHDPSVTILIHAYDNYYMMLNKLFNSIKKCGDVNSICQFGHPIPLESLLNSDFSRCDDVCKKEDFAHWKTWVTP
jgi:hypothetical protein